MFRNPRGTPAMANDRLRKAETLLTGATMIREHVADEPEIAATFVTLLVRAGVAAAESVCCRALGEHAPTDEQTVELLQEVAPEGHELANLLGALLDARLGGADPQDPFDAGTRMRCRRAAERLVQAARDRALR